MTWGWEEIEREEELKVKSVRKLKRQHYIDTTRNPSLQAEADVASLREKGGSSVSASRLTGARSLGHEPQCIALMLYYN